MICHIQSNLTGIAPLTSGISHSISAAHSTVDFVSFGWPALGLSELNFVTARLFSYHDAGETVTETLSCYFEQISHQQKSKTSVGKFEPYMQDNKIQLCRYCMVQQRGEKLFHSLEGMSAHWITAGHSLTLINMPSVFTVMFYSAWLQGIFLFIIKTCLLAIGLSAFKFLFIMFPHNCS